MGLVFQTFRERARKLIFDEICRNEWATLSMLQDVCLFAVFLLTVLFCQLWPKKASKPLAVGSFANRLQSCVDFALLEIRRGRHRNLEATQTNVRTVPIVQISPRVGLSSRQDRFGWLGSPSDYRSWKRLMFSTLQFALCTCIPNPVSHEPIINNWQQTLTEKLFFASCR